MIFNIFTDAPDVYIFEEKVCRILTMERVKFELQYNRRRLCRVSN